MAVLKKIYRVLQERWEVKNPWQLLVIFVVFGITGSLAAYISEPVLHWFGVTSKTAWWVKTPLYLATIFPAYQVILIVVGTLLGQFRFFWNFEKKMFGRMFQRSVKKQS